MLKRFVQYIQQQHLFSKEQEVLLAVSGGRDSVVLVELMYQAGYHFSIAHCNFHLRPIDCDRDQKFVVDLAKYYHVECHVVNFNTYDYASKNHLSIEEAARILRYDYFEELRVQYHYDVIATGHHRDDSTETFFINLLRGTGIAGLHGILPKQGYIVRPLLPFGREEINDFVHHNGLAYVEDYTNSSTNYRRNQIRHILMPVLRQLSPTVDSSMQQTISHLLDVEQLYRLKINEIRSSIFCKEGDVIKISITAIDKLTPQNTIMYELLHPYGYNESQIKDILKGIHLQSGKKFITDNYCLIIDRKCLLLQPISLIDNKPILKSEVVDRESLVTLKTPATVALFDADKITEPYQLRHWRVGDRFIPFGMSGSQLVSDYFIDHKFTLLEKQKTWILTDSFNHVLWIVGYRVDGRFSITSSTKRVLRIEIV